MQPFGGEGLSGTGPKAGGPLYLYRLLSQRPDDMLACAMDDVEKPDHAATALPRPALHLLAQWAAQNGEQKLGDACRRFAAQSRSGSSRELPGPTGERNVYSLVPRQRVLCLARDDGDLLVQLAAVLSAGSRAVWPLQAGALLNRVPAGPQSSVSLATDWTRPELAFDAVLFHGDTPALQEIRRKLAARPGPIIGIERLAPGDTAVPLERLVSERAVSINTAAAGGNASLMTIDY